MVSPSEGNEARRDGRQGVGALHSSVETGERPSGPSGAKGAPRCGLKAGPTPGTPSPGASTHEANGSCEGQRPQRDEPDAGNPHVGICGSLGVKTPRRPGPVPLRGRSPDPSHGSDELANARTPDPSQSRGIRYGVPGTPDREARVLRSALFLRQVHQPGEASRRYRRERFC